MFVCRKRGGKRVSRARFVCGGGAPMFGGDWGGGGGVAAAAAVAAAVAQTNFYTIKDQFEYGIEIKAALITSCALMCSPNLPKGVAVLVVFVVVVDVVVVHCNSPYAGGRTKTCIIDKHTCMKVAAQRLVR